MRFYKNYIDLIRADAAKSHSPNEVPLNNYCNSIIKQITLNELSMMINFAF